MSITGSTKHATKLRRVRLIYARDGRRCWWCGLVLLPISEVPHVTDNSGLPADYPTLDHLVPRASGGDHGLENLVVACRECNSRRGNNVAAYSPPTAPLVLEEITKCPDCEDGAWVDGDGRLCPTCDGAGELSASRAVTLFIEQRRRARSKETARMRAAGEAKAYKRIIETELGPGSTRRDLATTVRSQREIIHRLSDLILVLKVRLAEATGDDLRRMIPHPRSYDRALSLAAAPLDEDEVDA